MKFPTFHLNQVENGVAKGVFVLRLVRSCLVASDADISDDPYEYVASVLVNLTRIELGRKLVLDPNRGIFRQILPQIESRNSVRKQGVSPHLFFLSIMDRSMSFFVRA